MLAGDLSDFGNNVIHLLILIVLHYDYCALFFVQFKKRLYIVTKHLVTSAQYKIVSKYTKVNLLPVTGKCSRQK
jgi:hypothetical protein